MRINLYGGPNIGKSTIARYLVAMLSMKGLSVELVDEFVKQWAYLGRIPEGWDQHYIFSSQLQREWFYLNRGVNHIITDSPILLQTCYMNGLPFQYRLVGDSQSFDKEFPAVHVILKRSEEVPYVPVGRWGSLELAKEKDREVELMVRGYAIGEVWEHEVASGPGPLFSKIEGRIGFDKP